MNINIFRTKPGTRTFPVHKHNCYEIIFYLYGKGTLHTSHGNYSFSRGTAIIIPPGTYHNTVAECEYSNIAINGDFHHLFNLERPAIITDNVRCEGEQLVKMIYNNRYEGEEYLSSLCTAYTHFILRNLKIESNISAAVNRIIDEITDRFSDSDINLRDILIQSGYAEDYIRSCFKKFTSKTPNEFLSDVRITNACCLIEAYGNAMSLMQISENCGYTDYVYFSKKFRSLTGMSPKEYLNRSQ